MCLVLHVHNVVSDVSDETHEDVCILEHSNRYTMFSFTSFINKLKQKINCLLLMQHSVVRCFRQC